ncbi:MAG: signal recognition particle-docking protein FtsY [Acidobacteria bacterium]|nr:signal recognition particle-docking protein FtsY [Acidobacteriota bacterium]
MGFVGKLKKGLTRTSGRLSEGLGRIFLGKKEIDENIGEDLEEVLIEADIGIRATEEILEMVAEGVSRRELKDKKSLIAALKEKVREMVEIPDRTSLLEASEKPLVVLIVGVNGVGKTTTIGKLGKIFRDQGKTVLFSAADTFRAAAIDQLGIWADRIGADLVRHKPGADPSAVAFDSVQAAVNRGLDVVLIDTAGRLHTKDNLMAQLEKMKRVIAKVIQDAPHRILLILDGTNGQNALSQAREFMKTTGVTDLIITKLDGTAKGGAIIPIIREFQIPIGFVGVGEQEDDLIPFDAEEFAELLFAD